MVEKEKNLIREVVFLQLNCDVLHQKHGFSDILKNPKK